MISNNGKKYRLNHASFERAKALIKSGKYLSAEKDHAWSFSPEDGNSILGFPANNPRSENWTEYALWFLGEDESAGTVGEKSEKSKDRYAYPYGKGGNLYLSALRAIIAAAAADMDISDAAQELLDAATARDADLASSTGTAKAAHDVYFSGGKLDIEASFSQLDQMSEAEMSPRIPRFNMVGYTGNPMKLQGKSRPGLNFDYPVVIDMDGLDGLDKSRPILKGHDQEMPLGHTDKLQVENNKLVAAGPVSNFTSPQGKEVISSSKNGFPWQASIGADIIKNEFVPAGRTAEANGRTYPGPVNIARKSVLGEISFVALGADDDTSASIAAAKASAQKGKTIMKFKAWAKAKGFTDSDLEGKMCTGIRAAYQASADYDAEDPEGQEPKDGKDGDAKAKGARQLDVAASATGTDTSATGVADIRAEGARIASIQSRFGTAIQAARGELVKQLTDTQTKAINDGWSDEQAATQIELFTLRASRNPVDHQDGSPFNIQTGGVGANITNDVLASAAALSFGIPEKVALTRRDGTKLSEAEGNAAISGRLKGMGLQQIMGIVASAHGIHVAPGPMSNDTINAVIHAERRLDILGADAGFSTVSLLGITENIMNKAMLVGYGDVPSNVEDICYQTDTNDFKAFKRYRMTSSGRMQPVTSAGELKSFGLQDESYANQVSTQGMILTIRREDVINDDMGALTEAPKALGREAAQCREQAVFTTFLAGLATLFPVDGSKGNYFDGAASPLSVPSITTAVQKFMEQVDANNRPINIVPDRILIPPALAGVANGIYAKDSGLVVTALGSTAAKAVEPNKNIHSGLYRPIVSPYMANRAGKGLAGSSDTQWILLPNPSGGLAVVQIGYLRGQRTPIIERGEAPFTVLGIQMRCIYDFGVALHDYRCGVYSKGTS